MNFGQIIQKSISLKGSGRAVADWLNIAEQQITDAKGGRRGLPDRCCLQLAQLLGMDFGKVIAARNEWTAKSEEERNFWHPLANAAGIAAISLCFVTSLLTPSPAQAAPSQALRSTPLCIMSNIRRRFMHRAYAIWLIVSGNWNNASYSYYFEDYRTI